MVPTEMVAMTVINICYESDLLYLDGVDVSLLPAVRIWLSEHNAQGWTWRWYWHRGLMSAVAGPGHGILSLPEPIAAWFTLRWL